MPALLWLKKIPREIWYLLGIGLLIWYVYHLGAESVQTKWDAANKDQASTASRLKQQTTIVLRAVETVHSVKTQVIKEKGATIVKEIPIYIPVDSPDLPTGFVKLHDAAVTNSSPEDARFADARPIGLATATRTILGNYTICEVNRQQLLSLQSAVQQVEETYAQMCKSPGVRCSEGKFEN